MSRGLRRIGALVLLLVSAPILGGPFDAFRGEFWTDLDGVPRVGEEWPLSDKTAAERVLSEAAWIFSGMVEGFTFVWTPENRGRKVAEEFLLAPGGRIEAGDPRLVPGAATRDLLRLRAWIEFRPDAADAAYIEASRSSDWVPSQGRGGVDRIRGFEGRRGAYEAAIKAAIEAWARSVEPNRPRSVSGRVVLAAVPTLAIVEGAYLATVRVRIQVTELRRWGIW